MARRTLLSALPLSLLLTGCPLTDHYQLLSDDAGASDAGARAAAAGAGASTAGASASTSGASASTAGSAGGAPASLLGGFGGCAVGQCGGRWVAIKPPPTGVVARSRAASVAMGKNVFFWGGLDAAGNALDNGAVYTPSTDSWGALPKDTGSPSARVMASAVWTGNVVVVYGGTDAAGGTVYRDGAVYDPVNNNWTPLPSSPALRARGAPFAYWDGTRAIFWGGLNAMAAGVPGADRFDLTNWSTSTNSGDPGALAYPSVAFNGSVMYLLGGLIGGTRQDKVYSYTGSTNSWSSLPSSLSARSGAFGVWDGTRFVVWGGRDDNGMHSDGKSLSGSNWTALSATGAPSARGTAFRRSGWCFQVSPGVVAIIGGQTSISGTGTLSTNGGIYDVLGSQWTPISDWPSGEAHEYGMGTWTGDTFVLWGGRDANVSTNTGERWSP